MKLLNRRALFSLIAGCTILASPLAQAEDATDAVQNVVMSYQQDPTEKAGLEAACVALQLATGLLSGADVTIFATLDGVYIADEGTYEDVEKGKKGKGGKKGRRGRHDEDDDGPICETFQDGKLGTKPLRDVLNGFLDAEGEVLVCPLCFAVRQAGGFQLIDDPQIYVANPIPLLLEANKVIDY